MKTSNSCLDPFNILLCPNSKECYMWKFVPLAKMSSWNDNKYFYLQQENFWSHMQDSGSYLTIALLLVTKKITPNFANLKFCQLRWNFMEKKNALISCPYHSNSRKVMQFAVEEHVFKSTDLQLGREREMTITSELCVISEYHTGISVILGLNIRIIYYAQNSLLTKQNTITTNYASLIQDTEYYFQTCISQLFFV